MSWNFISFSWILIREQLILFLDDLEVQKCAHAQSKSCLICIIKDDKKIVKGGGGGFTLHEIYIGFCPRTDFYNIMHIACLVHGHLISNIDFLLTT